MLCAVSGSVPEEPVVSTKSGHLFEKSVIEKYIKEYGKCPITGEVLTEDDVVAIKTGQSIKPRAAPATSIPGLLGLMHNEWDALMLETFELRQQLTRAREELAHSLYQHDASCRVVARLTRERDAAYANIADLKTQVESGRMSKAAPDHVPAQRPRQNGGSADEPDAKRAKGGVPPEVAAAIDEKNKELFASRKAMSAGPPPEGIVTQADVERFTLTATQPLHSTMNGGVLAVAMAPAARNEEPAFVATGGADHTVQIFDIKSSRIAATLTGHSKKVTAVAYASGTRLLSGSADKTVKVWEPSSEGSWGLKATLKDFSSSVVRLCVHPVNRYSVTVCADASWHMHDLEAGEMMTQVVGSTETDGRYLCGAVHPDGAFLGVGSSMGKLSIFDVKTNAVIIDLTDNQPGDVHDVCFNENGFWAAISKNSGVQVWDLRKMKSAVELQPYEDAPTTCLGWDRSGKFLACGGPEVKVYEIASLKKKGHKAATATVLKTLVDLPGKKGANCLAFGALGKSLHVGASDHNLRTFTC